MLQALEAAASGLPVADAVRHELQGARLPEIAERENALEDGLQTDIVPFLRQEVHLEEVLIGLALDVDEVRKGQKRADLAEARALLLARGECASVHGAFCSDPWVTGGPDGWRTKRKRKKFA
jgi:hypothetical protein